MNEIDKKVEELAKLAEKENDSSLLIILLAYQGAKLTNCESLFAINVQKYVREVLLPVTSFSKNK